MSAPTLEFRSALRLVAESLPAGSAIPVRREELLVLLAENGDAPSTPVQSDRLLTAEEAAERLGMSKEWIYKKAARLPFTVRVGSRALRFSSTGIDKYQARRRH
jgi:excisionase family DNA binding protein